MTAATITKLLILGTIAVWVTWDFRAFKLGGYDATETATIRRWSRHPLVPFALGILMGHFFACPL